MPLPRLLAWTAIALCTASPALADRTSDLEKALAAEGRSAEDRARDAGREPAHVIAFLGIAPGDTVLDVIAAGGWYTEVLSIAVGEAGTVHAQNPPAVLRFRDGANDEALSARLAGGRLANVKRHDADLADLSLAPGSVDVAITALNFHDVYNGRGPDAAVAFLREVHHLLKPGGVLGIIDHHGDAGADNEALHRIELGLVKEVVERSPFVLDAESDLLRNEADDRTKQVFDPEIRGRTDRFLLRLRKPHASQDGS